MYVRTDFDVALKYAKIVYADAISDTTADFVKRTLPTDLGIVADLTKADFNQLFRAEVW